jgi:hypothetical protein
MGPPYKKPVLCLSGQGTAASVRAVARERGLDVVAVQSVAEAVALLKEDQFCLLIAALGTTPQNIILDQGNCSTLLERARALHPAIVFSHTACSSPRARAVCIAAGAGAVVCSKATLSTAMDELGVERTPAATSAEGDTAEHSAVGQGAIEYATVGYESLHVPTCASIQHFAYLAPGGDTLVPAHTSAPPPTANGCLRVVCIADTHNEHESLVLPAGDVLLHAGDCLTASGTRHVERRSDGSIVRVHPEGEALFTRFATWLGAQPFRHRLLVGGNHDLVLQGLGAERVQQILAASTTVGDPPVYLEHTSTTIAGGLRVFGSPFAHYAGRNDAFLVPGGCDFSDMPNGCDIVVTHMPCVLPAQRGPHHTHEDDALSRALQRTGASLHVSGHCHWAHGLYHTTLGRGVPCVVASVSDSHWVRPLGLKAASGMRGDPADAQDGGYNVELCPIVCDVQVLRDADATARAAADAMDEENGRGVGLAVAS